MIINQMLPLHWAEQREALRPLGRYRKKTIRGMSGLINHYGSPEQKRLLGIIWDKFKKKEINQNEANGRMTTITRQMWRDYAKNKQET